MSAKADRRRRGGARERFRATGARAPLLAVACLLLGSALAGAHALEGEAGEGEGGGGADGLLPATTERQRSAAVSAALGARRALLAGGRTKANRRAAADAAADAAANATGYLGVSRRDFVAHNFDPARDTFVYTHIQKTGGSFFGLRLAKWQTPTTHCTTRDGTTPVGEEDSHSIKFRPRIFRCLRPKVTDAQEQFLVSRLTTGWNFGVHASWRRIKEGLGSARDARAEFSSGGGRKYHITIVRAAAQRLVSEWCHLLRLRTTDPVSDWTAWNDGVRNAKHLNHMAQKKKLQNVVPVIPSDLRCGQKPRRLVDGPKRCNLQPIRLHKPGEKDTNGRIFNCQDVVEMLRVHSNKRHVAEEERRNRTAAGAEAFAVLQHKAEKHGQTPAAHAAMVGEAEFRNRTAEADLAMLEDLTATVTGTQVLPGEATKEARKAAMKLRKGGMRRRALLGIFPEGYFGSKAGPHGGHRGGKTSEPALPELSEEEVRTLGESVQSSLAKFLECEDNPAFNRQTRMLSDRPCNNDQATHFVNAESLKSAKEVLTNVFAFFAVNEEIPLSEALFVRQFGGQFAPEKHKVRPETVADDMMQLLPPALLAKVNDKCSLDAELYAYAKQLFDSRLAMHGLGLEPERLQRMERAELEKNTARPL